MGWDTKFKYGYKIKYIKDSPDILNTYPYLTGGYILHKNDICKRHGNFTSGNRID
jgi:hypothetical protein